MTNSDLFKQAHALTRATIQAGDDYRTTFGACLKQIKAEANEPALGVSEYVSATFEALLNVVLLAMVLSPTAFIVTALGDAEAAYVALFVSLCVIVCGAINGFKEALQDALKQLQINRMVWAR